MILLRHGESHFNVVFNATRTDPGIPDPGLTESGRRQIQEAAERLRPAAIERIVASPYARTLETAEIVAATLGMPVHVEASVRERCFFSCDIGTPRSLLAARWPAFDFGSLDERWWPELGESETELQLRCDAFRQNLAASPDWDEALVVSHWGFIRGLTGEELKNGQITRYRPNSI